MYIFFLFGKRFQLHRFLTEVNLILKKKKIHIMKVHLYNIQYVWHKCLHVPLYNIVQIKLRGIDDCIGTDVLLNTYFESLNCSDIIWSYINDPRTVLAIVGARYKITLYFSMCRTFSRSLEFLFLRFVSSRLPFLASRPIL